jgi:hypothetical protein
VEDLDNDLSVMTHGEGEEGIDNINANGLMTMTKLWRVKRWRAATYLEVYEQNIGLIERGTGLTAFHIFVNYSAQQYCINTFVVAT